jgi:hypothetical protein
MNISWNDIKSQREHDLLITDIYCLYDRFTQLTTAEQTELSNFRKTLRDLPQTYDDAKEAWSNYPPMPSFVKLLE